MKVQIKIAFALFVLFTGSYTLSAQDNKLQLKGYLLTDQRFRLKNDNPWSWNENRLDLQLEKKISGAKFYSDIWVRNFGFPNITSADQLYNPDETSPINMQFREGYVSLYGFLSKNLDVTIGRQRIAWGTGDKLNPTDNLNAYDLEDIWDFGRHFGSDAVRMVYYMNDFRIEGVYIPFFRPASLPAGDWISALVPQPDLPPGMQINSFTDTLFMPQNNLSNSYTAALKFGGYLKGFDFSLSYVYNIDGLPVTNYNTFVPVDTIGGVTIESQAFYPRQHIFGADMAGAIGSVGVWAEAAMFLPEEEVVMSNDLSLLYPQSPVPVIVDTVVLEKKPYVKFVVGTDYTFGDGSYVNFQYLHGFIHERGSENLNDYFMIGYEKKFFNDNLKIVPLAGAFVVGDWDDIQNNYAIIYAPSISYFPNENTEINIGVRLLEGKGDNTFAKVTGKDEFVVSLKYSF